MVKRCARVAKQWGRALLLAAGFVGAAGPALADLRARDLTGDGVTDAYYDTVLNITWLKDANYARTSGFDSNGLMDWDRATRWADSLVFGGYSDWRLASAGDDTSHKYCLVTLGAAGCAAEGNELVYMYLWNLNGQFGGDRTGTQTYPGFTFENIAERYWSGTQDGSVRAWSSRFNAISEFGIHRSDSLFKFQEYAAWAVRPGDVIAPPIPEPETYAMLLAGLGLLGWRTRRG